MRKIKEVKRSKTTQRSRADVMKYIQPDYGQDSCMCTLCGKVFSAKKDVYFVTVWINDSYCDGDWPICSLCSKIDDIKSLYLVLLEQPSWLRPVSSAFRRAVEDAKEALGRAKVRVWDAGKLVEMDDDIEIDYQTGEVIKTKRPSKPNKR